MRLVEITGLGVRRYVLGVRESEQVCMALAERSGFWAVP